MKVKAISVIIVALLLIGTLTLIINIQPIKSDWISSETIYIRADGSIDPPDAPILTVDNITYTVIDNIVGVNLSTAIVVERNNIILDGAGYTLQEGSDEGIYLEGISNVTIKNMKIKAFSYGIYLSMSNSCNIFNNEILDNFGYGMSLVDSSDNEILNNMIVNNTAYGIRMTREVNDNVSNNVISESAYGIRLLGATDNYIINNTVTGTSYGIYIADTSPRNTVKYNKVKSETAAIYVGGLSHNTVVDHNIVSPPGSAGIYLYNSDSCTITYNTISGNITFGIRLYYSCDNNYFYNNKIAYTRWGVEIDYSSNNNYFVGNWLEQNAYGVDIVGATGNTFNYNNFIRNDVQVGGDPVTIHENTFWYNYWSDWVPGYPHPIDPFPLLEPWSEHDISLVSVSLSATSVYVGETVNITVVVENEGKLGQSETFDVTAKYSENLIETQTVTNLASGTDTTLTFHWDTTYVEAPLTYTISVEAILVPDELDYTDNLVVDGTVEVNQQLKPWWFLPSTLHYETGLGSNRTTITCVYPMDTGVPPPTVINTTNKMSFDLDISAPNASGLASITIPQASIHGEEFYIRNPRYSIYTIYLWGRVYATADGNGTLDTVGGNLNVDIFTTATGHGDGTSTVTREFKNNVTGNSRPGDLLLFMPLNLTLWQGTSPTDPTPPPEPILSEINVELPLYLTTGYCQALINDINPFPSGSVSMHGLRMNDTGVPADPYTGAYTGVAAGAVLDVYGGLIFIPPDFIPIYGDSLFVERQVAEPQPPIEQEFITNITVSAPHMGSAYPGELVNITVTVENGLDYYATFNITVYAINDPIIIANITNLPMGPHSNVTETVTWNTTGVPYGNYTITAELHGKVVIDSKTYTLHDVYTDGNVLVTTEELHDVAVTSVMPSKTVVGEGYSVKINVTVKNQGDFAETFNVTAYYGNETLTFEQWEIFWSTGDINRDGYVDDIDVALLEDAYGSRPGDPNWNPDADLDQDGDVDQIDAYILSGGYGLDIWTYFNITGGSIQDQPVSNLSPGSSTTFVFTWNTTGVPYGNYTISTKATKVPGEWDTTDNIYDDGTVVVTIPGDFDGDGDVDLSDFYIFTGSYLTSPPADPRCDFDGDGDVDLSDFYIFTGNYLAS